MKIYRNNINDALLKSRMKKICNILKIPRVAELCYEHIRGSIKVFLENMIMRIIHVAAFFQKNLVTLNMIYSATERYDILPSAKIKSCFQKPLSSPCYVFPKYPFERFIREIFQDEGSKLQFDKHSLPCIQMITEHYLRHILRNARLVMLQAKRKTLYPSDLMVVENSISG